MLKQAQKRLARLGLTNMEAGFHIEQVWRLSVPPAQRLIVGIACVGAPPPPAAENG
jgi:hypothetical protein